MDFNANIFTFRKTISFELLKSSTPLEVLLLGVDCHFDAHLRLKIRQCYNQYTNRMTTFDIN